MIIGVDAGMLGISDERLAVGVWRVAVNLLRELGKIDKVNSYRLYSFRPIPKTVLNSFGARMQNFVLKPSWGWFSWRLPLELMQHPVDVFLGLGQAMPQIEAKKIGFIYDLGFLEYPEFYPGTFKKLSTNTIRLLDRSNLIITISDFVKKQLIQKYQILAKTIEVAYPGVSDIFHQDKTQRDLGKPYFLFVGSLKPQKNAALLVASYLKFREESEKDPDLVLVGGDFWPDQEFEKIIRNPQLKNHLKVLGHVSDEVLARLYREALSLIIPSRVEGFCLPAVEAMASGCPIVASKAGSLPEIVGDAGLFFDSGDQEELSKLLSIVATSQTIRSKLIKSGLKRSANYSWKNFAKSIYEAYEK